MKNNQKIAITLFFVAFLLFSSCKSSKQQVHYADLKYPKREFRGAWIHTVGQRQYQNMNSEQMKTYFVDMLNKLHAAGINAVVFQVRPQADAFYYSEIEPWSRYLTGTQGKAPDNNFDPLEFMVRECHKRNMELHAWLNPYRVTNSEDQILAGNHIYHSNPELFVKYGTQIYFDPGIPANRKFICKVVKDIVARYDVDAIHMDDYFYPYPIVDKSFPDDKSFATYAAAQGFGANERGDWRRNNVNLLIREIKDAISVTKPWVRFGVSPFGIYRNKKNTPDNSGSETNGLQNYDELYADIKLWTDNAWVDYNIPQVYWEIGHKAADHKELVNWWSRNAGLAHLYIGQDVVRTMNAVMPSGDTQLSTKMILSRSYTTVYGNCYWSGYNLLDNYRGISDELSENYQKYPSLIPAYTHMHNKAPKDVNGLKEDFTPTNHYLKWEPNSKKDNPETAQYYVVYRFASGEKKDTNDATKIVTITQDPFIVLPYEGGKIKYEYVVTSVDRFHNESKGKSKKIKL